MKQIREKEMLCSCQCGNYLTFRINPIDLRTYELRVWLKSKEMGMVPSSIALSKKQVIKLAKVIIESLAEGTKI